ncbi:hypothetical protein YPPY66_1181, partial [Yersinia pestis PY-66]
MIKFRHKVRLSQTCKYHYLKNRLKNT